LPQPSHGQSFIYGSVGPRLQAIKTMLIANPAAGDAWRPQFAPDHDRNLASLLLLDQRMSSPSSTILFGSTKPAHVAALAVTISSQDRANVMRLREWARTATKMGVD
jgi:hypothetical protein